MSIYGTLFICKKQKKSDGIQKSTSNLTCVHWKCVFVCSLLLLLVVFVGARQLNLNTHIKCIHVLFGVRLLACRIRLNTFEYNIALFITWFFSSSHSTSILYSFFSVIIGYLILFVWAVLVHMGFFSLLLLLLVNVCSVRALLSEWNVDISTFFFSLDASHTYIYVLQLRIQKLIVCVCVCRHLFGQRNGQKWEN